MSHNAGYPQKRYLKPEEVRRLLDQPSLRSQSGLRNRCVMQLMYESGLRIAEALALKPRDLHLEEKRVEVWRGKAGRSRTTYWQTDELTILVDLWKTVRCQTGETLFCAVKRSPGVRLNPNDFRETFRRYVEKAQLDPKTTTPHILRHTFGTELLRRSKNIRVVQESLGHAWVSTTQLYTHVDPEEVAQAIRGY